MRFWIVGLTLALLAPPSWGASTQLINGFEYPSEKLAQRLWHPLDETAPVRLVSHPTERGRKALEFPCDFPRLQERAYWDREVRLDLRLFGRFRVWFNVQGADAIRQGTIYFRSGDGWFGAWFLLQEGEQWITLNKSDFHLEGSPAGWDRIETIRVAFWKAVDKRAVVQMDELEGVLDDIVVVRGNRSQRAQPTEWRAVQQYASQMARHLERLGVTFGVLDDTDVEQGALEGTRLAIFPYNPHMTDQEVEAIAQFMRQGGKVFLFYVLPEPLRPLLGIRDAEWTQATTDGQFASIRLSGVPGLPPSILQGSWNVRIPKVDGAKVIGTWVDAEDQPTRIPALTLHANGAFMGHVLLSGDVARKQQMLLAILMELLPDRRRSLAEAMLTRMGGVGYLTDLEQTRTFVQANLSRLPESRRAVVKKRLKAAQKLQKKAARAIRRAEFEEALKHAYTLREAISEAYFRSFPTRPGEFRAVWCHDAYGIPGESWDEAIARLAQYGFNAIVPNMLWAGVAYYPSKVLPVAPEVAERGDAIAEALRACRKYGVQIHVWKVNWNLSRAPEDFIQQLREQGRLQRDRYGNEVLWLCPSHPDNFKLEVDSMLEVVRNYPVDGIHFDYIRYPNQDACYGEGCRRRFEEATGVHVEHWPEDVITGDLAERFSAWRQAQITRLVRQVSQEARRIRPGIQISAAVFRDYPNCRKTVGQDWVRWIEEGYLDFVCPMDYTTDASQFERLVTSQKQWVRGRVPLYPGIGASLGGMLPGQTAWQIHRARKLGMPGFILFNYDRGLAQEHLPKLSLGLTRPLESSP